MGLAELRLVKETLGMITPLLVETIFRASESSNVFTVLPIPTCALTTE